MSKSKKSILNAVSALGQMLVTSILGLIFNKVILETFGSEYNGINATVTQIINTIMIVEGGFTLASNVALFEPWGTRNLHLINGILAATKKRFWGIGCISVCLGIVVSFIYPFTVKGSIQHGMVVGLMMTALIPACYNLGITTKYRVVLLTDQKEYIISIISTLTYAVGTFGAIMFVRHLQCSLLIARIIIMFSLLCNYFLIGVYCRVKYKFILFSEKPLYGEIKGTKSVIMMKITSVIYSSAPIVVISMIPENGFILASVYAVYNSIMAVISGGLNAIVNAPRLSLGALFAEKDNSHMKKVYSLYEMISFVSITIVLGTTAIMILPFVGIYTRDVADANYRDVLLAVILIAKNFAEIIHIPAGQIIQMSGHFNIAKKIQMIACIILTVILLIGLVVSNMYVVVLAMLVAAVVLAILEVSFAELTIVKRKGNIFFKRLCASFFIVLIACLIGMSDILKCNNYFEFIFLGIVCFSILSVISLYIFYSIDKESVQKIVKFILNNVMKKSKKK